MGAAAAPVAGAASIASMGLSAYGDIKKGEGDSAASAFAAEKSRKAAEFGRITADQTDTQFRENLMDTLGKIDAIRASSGVNPDSPTAVALADEETRVSDRARTNRVASIRGQALQDDADALYRDRVSRDALTAGYVRAGATVTKGLAGMLRP